MQAAPTLTTITLTIDDATRDFLTRALFTEERRLLSWLEAENDNLLPEWSANYDTWQSIQLARETLEGEMR